MPRFLLLITALALSPVCLGDPRPLVVYTVNYPLEYFAQRIAGDHAKVVFPAPAGIDPAFWSPDPETINDYQRADLILLNGAGYARWVQTATLSPLRLVDTARSFSDRLIVADDEATHTHGPGGDHSHAGLAFATWLDLELAAQHAEAIRAALAQKSPEHAEAFERNFTLLKQDLTVLDRALSEVSGRVGDTRLLASHPVYQYLARRYSLDVTSLAWEPDAMPEPAAWRGLASLLDSHAFQWMLWEAEPLPEIRARLEELSIGVIVFDPGFNTPEQGDFLDVMSRNVDNLRAALN